MEIDSELLLTKLRRGRTVVQERRRWALDWLGELLDAEEPNYVEVRHKLYNQEFSRGGIEALTFAIELVENMVEDAADEGEASTSGRVFL